MLDEIFAMLAPAALTAIAQALAEVNADNRRDLAVLELAAELAQLRGRPVAARVSIPSFPRIVGGKGLGGHLEALPAAARAAENDLIAQRARRPVTLTEQELAAQRRRPTCLGQLEVLDWTLLTWTPRGRVRRAGARRCSLT